MNPSTGADDQSPFLRTLHGGAGISGSEVVSDRSGVIYKLGRRFGSTGDVFELENSPFSEPVVIKLFPRAAGIDAGAVDAFARAAIAASALGHPQIARTLDAGVLENGTPFLVVERLRGETLKELFARRLTLPAADALDILRAVGGALAAVHAAGLIHGEVRPDNIFVSDGRRRDQGSGLSSAVKLLDFGACYLTAPLRPVGSAASDDAQAFLSPEQQHASVAPDHLDGRSDEYALGVLARRLLAPNQSRRSPALTAILAMATNHDPNDRFDSIEQFMSALVEVVGGVVADRGAGGAVAPVRRETLKPLLDLEVTPIGGNTPIGSNTPVVSNKPSAVPHRRTPSNENARSYGAVTRQFFEDGNRISEEAAAAALSTSDSSMSMSALRIPRHRRGKVVAIVGGMAALGVAAVVWSGMFRPLLTVGARAGAVFPSKTAQPAPAPVAAQPSAPEGAQPVAAAPPAAVPAPPAAAPVTAVPAPGTPASPPGGAPVATAPAAVAPAAAPVVVPLPSGAAGQKAGTVAPSRARDNQSAEARGPAEAPSPTVARHPGGRREPLRGYVWSPAERRLVPSNRAAGTSSFPPSSAPPQWSVPSPSAASSSSLDVPPPAATAPTTPPPQPAAPIIDDSAATAPAPEPAPSTR